MRFCWFVIIFFLSISAFAQQGTIKARLVEKDKQQPVSNYYIWLNTFKFQTNDKGEIEATIPYGKYVFVVSGDEYEIYSQKVELNSPELDLGTIELISKNVSNQDISVVAEQTISSDDIDDKQGQNISGLLHAFNDPFVSIASFNLSAFNYRTRGYDAANISVSINGLPMNDFENGRASYSDWGGLNNVTRNKVSTQGIDATWHAFGNIGGSTNILMNAGNIRKQNQLSYAISNRSYTHRIMYSYASGFNEKGLAYAFSVSKRYAERGYVKGTWYDAYSYYASIEKKWNQKHQTAITVFGAPYKRGMQAPATQEAFDLIGSNYYNPNWGYQDGIVRNAKVRNVHQPMLILTETYRISDKQKLNFSTGYQFGRFGTTALNWYQANDPRPDYYRYLPSYQTTPYLQEITTQYWTSSPDVYQINWNQLYQINYLAKMSGQSARYIVEEQRKDNNQWSYNLNYTYDVNDRSTFIAGLYGMAGKTHYFKVINDLLGADYWLDIDQYAERDFPDNPSMLQNDMNNPNKPVKVGDIFGYNYNIHYQNQNGWLMYQHITYRFDYFAQVQASATSFYRNGFMRNGRYPNESYGKSNVNSYIHYAAKAGSTYKITGRHLLSAHAAYIVQPPLPENAYINARTSSRVVSNLDQESILAGEATYTFRGINTIARITAYQTYFNNQTDIRSFYHDQYQTFVNILLQNIDKVHQGIEMGAEVKLHSSLSIVGGYNFGNYRYTSRPTATISYDNGSKPDTTETIYMKYFYVPGPQNAGSIGLKYRHPKFWFASIHLNQYDKNYLDFNPERRTELAISNLGPNDPLIAQITQQQKLKGGYTIDFSLGKSWKIGNQYLAFNLNINNILNNTSLITGGYEQMRFDFQNKNVNKFPPKYFYAYGRTYFFMISYRF
ncbi:MAG: TonB-dependent receptor plug domain-containing protein [Bacteroidales bacterium]|nr:TonB-dependent receptor plug domain-containing protein [Bacteroidales bacterium]